MGEKLSVNLRNDITYGGVEHLSFSSSLMVCRGEGEVSKSVDRWIVATGVEPRIPPIPGHDHPNVLSYVDVLRRYTNIGNRVAIIRVRGVF